MLERMVSRDTLALRRMAESRAELVRFSRFFNNPKVTPAEILASAAARTAEAAAGRHVLLIEDSTQSPLGKCHRIVTEGRSRVMDAKSIAAAETCTSVS